MPLQFEARAAHVHAMIKAALAAADPFSAVSRNLRRDGRTLQFSRGQYELDKGRLFLIAVGKAAHCMARSALTILENDIQAGIVIAKTEPSPPYSHPAFLTFFKGNHPIPGQDSIRATTAVRQLLKDTTENDLVLCLLSGGASALLSAPTLPLNAWQELNQKLLASGCTIQEFNIVRRQLDEVKGGGLARWAAPARCVSLILSDVVGSPLHLIGSGPTVPGEDTLAKALAILDKYQIELGTPLPLSHAFRKVPPPSNLIIGDVAAAAHAAAREAKNIGFIPQILTTHLEGEAREVGRFAAAVARDLPPEHCAILGGETTVTIQGSGLGGRNQETALAAALALDGVPLAVVASFATDGEDGPTDAAGAIVTGLTAGYGRARNLSLSDYLKTNDSYHFFQKLKDHLIITGPTGTNVNDLIIMIKYPA